jgi:hypothetical protein
MNLIRYLKAEDVPEQYTNWYWIPASGNEFSDRKSAALLIERRVAFTGKDCNTMRISVRQEPVDWTVRASCFYVKA